MSVGRSYVVTCVLWHSEFDLLQPSAHCEPGFPLVEPYTLCLQRHQGLCKVSQAQFFCRHLDFTKIQMSVTRPTWNISELHGLRSNTYKYFLPKVFALQHTGLKLARNARLQCAFMLHLVIDFPYSKPTSAVNLLGDRASVERHGEQMYLRPGCCNIQNCNNSFYGTWRTFSNGNFKKTTVFWDTALCGVVNFTDVSGCLLPPSSGRSQNAAIFRHAAVKTWNLDETALIRHMM